MFFHLCVNQCEEENEIMLAHLGNWDSSALECGNCGFPVVARNQVKSCTMHCTTTQPHNALHNHTMHCTTTQCTAQPQCTTLLCRTVEGVVVDCPTCTTTFDPHTHPSAIMLHSIQSRELGHTFPTPEHL